MKKGLQEFLYDYLNESKAFFLDYSTTYDSFLDFLKDNGYKESDLDADAPRADLKLDELSYCFGENKYYKEILVKSKDGNRCKFAFGIDSDKLKLVDLIVPNKTVDSKTFQDAVTNICEYMFPGKAVPGKNI